MPETDSLPPGTASGVFPRYGMLLKEGERSFLAFSTVLVVFLSEITELQSPRSFGHHRLRPWQGRASLRAICTHAFQGSLSALTVRNTHIAYPDHPLFRALINAMDLWNTYHPIGQDQDINHFFCVFVRVHVEFLRGDMLVGDTGTGFD